MTKKKKPWKVAELCIDVYQGNRNLRELHENPTLKQIQEAIQSLNGGNRSCICFADDGRQTIMCVGGGPTQVHSAVTFPKSVYSLASASEKSKEIDLIIGGVTTALPDNLITGMKEALAAARYFYKTGELDPSLLWMES